MGIAGSQMGVIDLQSGKQSGTVFGFFDSIVCLPPNEIVGLTKNEARWFSSGKTTGRSTGWRTHGALNQNQIIVSYRLLRRQTSTIFQWNGPLSVGIETLGNEGKAFNALDLSASLFPTLGNGPDDYLESIPIRLLTNRKLLVAAGFSLSKLEQKKPWGLFLVDLEGRKILPFGPMREGDDHLNLFVKMTRFATTSDGGIVAGSSGEGIVLLNSERAEEISHATLHEVREVQSLALNDKGTILAAALTSNNGQGRVEIFDVANAKTLWRTEYGPGVIYGLEFLADDSLVILQSGSGNNTVSRRNGKDGKIIWLTSI